ANDRRTSGKCAYDLIDGHWLSLPFDLHWLDGFQADIALDQSTRGCTHQDRSRLSNPLQTRCQVRRIPNGGIVHAEVVANTPNHHEPAVEPHTEGTFHPVGFPKMGFLQGTLQRQSG